MPIINIKSLPIQDHTNVAEILIKLNSAVAEILNIEPARVRSYWEFIKPGLYAEGKYAAAKVHNDSHSPIVSIKLPEGFSSEKIAEVMQKTASHISTELEIDFGNVFVSVEILKLGMEFAGGSINPF